MSADKATMEIPTDLKVKGSLFISDCDILEITRAFEKKLEFLSNQVDALQREIASLSGATPVSEIPKKKDRPETPLKRIERVMSPPKARLMRSVSAKIEKKRKLTRFPDAKGDKNVSQAKDDKNVSQAKPAEEPTVAEPASIEPAIIETVAGAAPAESVVTETAAPVAPETAVPEAAEKPKRKGFLSPLRERKKRKEEKKKQRELEAKAKLHDKRQDDKLGETPKIARLAIAPNGKVLRSPAGYSSSRSGIGKYKIKFPKYPKVPSLRITTDAKNKHTIEKLTDEKALIYCYQEDGRSFADVKMEVKLIKID